MAGGPAARGIYFGHQRSYEVHLRGTESMLALMALHADSSIAKPLCCRTLSRVKMKRARRNVTSQRSRYPRLSDSWAPRLGRHFSIRNSDRSCEYCESKFKLMPLRQSG